MLARTLCCKLIRIWEVDSLKSVSLADWQSFLEFLVRELFPKIFRGKDDDLKIFPAWLCKCEKLFRGFFFFFGGGGLELTTEKKPPRTHTFKMWNILQ
jgi:hypothetical protein